MTSKAPKIFTNVPGKISKTWSENTILIKGSFDTSEISDPHKVGGRLYSIKMIWKLFVKRKNADCFVTTGDLTGLGFALLQSLFPFGRKPHLIMSAIWKYPRNNIELFIRRIILPFAFRSVSNTFVNTSIEVKSYSKLFNIPVDKISFLPYCYRLTGYEYEIRDDGYIWSGGNGDRDYKTLIEAVRSIDIPVVINATRKSLFIGISIPDHVKVLGVSPIEFRQYMAGCSFGVIPMEGGKLHPGGQQTFLALMKMGKPVILTDPEGGKDYIDQDKNGILVKPGDVSSLRKAIQFLIDDPNKRKKMGLEAQASVAKNSEEDYLSSILNRALSAISK